MLYNRFPGFYKKPSETICECLGGGAHHSRASYFGHEAGSVPKGHCAICTRARSPAITGASARAGSGAGDSEEDTKFNSFKKKVDNVTREEWNVLKDDKN